MQTPNIRRKGAFDQHLDAVRGNLAEPGRFAVTAVTKVRAHRDLGSRTGSMVQADQIDESQAASLLDVLQGLGRERDRRLDGHSGVVLRAFYRLAKPGALYVKRRRHDAPTPGRFPFPIPL